MSPYPHHAARTLALHAQALTTPNGQEPDPTPDRIYDTIAQLGAVQIDTLQMVRRSHYVTLWSRLGNYDPAAFEQLAYGPDQRLFEYWLHAACLIPLHDYRWRILTMQHYRNGGGWRQQWGEEPENRPVVEHVRERITNEGGLRTSDFKHEGKKGGTWWDWKPAKLALEYLYNRGELMITDRVNFQRVYDLAERVLHDWVDTTPPTLDETIRYRIEMAARAAGIGTEKHIAEYTFLKRTEARPHFDALRDEGILIEVDVALDDGEKTQPMLIHRDHRDALQQAADGALVAERTTFLNPFDSLFWTKGRDMLLWDFRQTLEAYVPKPKRIWGYYCLPILHKDRLVGRFDPKLDRKTGTLILKALYLEPGIAPDDQLVADVAATMRDFLAWHEATDLVIEASDPGEFGTKLKKAL